MIRRARLHRRLIAVLLLLGFGLFTAEPLIADACDGDSGIVGVSTLDCVDDPQGSGDSVPASGHAIHVCHCVHAHGGMPARDQSILTDANAGFLVLKPVFRVPASPALELELRPPIV